RGVVASDAPPQQPVLRTLKRPARPFERPMTPDLDDTIVALSSAPGGGRRAIVRLSGAQALSTALARFTPAAPHTPRPRLVCPGARPLDGVSAPLPADLSFWQAPHSYTGQDLVELHTIGCPPLVELAIAQLLAAGARAARPGEFTLR